MKKVTIFLTIVFLILFSSKVFSQEGDVPEWLKRVEFSGQWETDKTPTVYFQTVQPLYQDELKVDTIFIQPRVSWQLGETTCNLGVGYRRLVSDDLLLGVNIFGDYEDAFDHGRVGLGLEALGQILETRFNTYFAMTSQRIVEETASSITYEKPVDGIDLEFGIPIPFLPWLKIYGSGFWYDFKKFDDKVGWRNRLEAKLNECIRLEFYAWDDNKGDEEYGGRVRFNLAFNNLFDFKEALQIAEEPFPRKDLAEQTLIPVERNFDIVVEKWNETATTNIEIYRGD